MVVASDAHRVFERVREWSSGKKKPKQGRLQPGRRPRSGPPWTLPYQTPPSVDVLNVHKYSGSAKRFVQFFSP